MPAVTGAVAAPAAPVVVTVAGGLPVKKTALADLSVQDCRGTVLVVR